MADREEGPNSYRVPIDKICESDWSFAAGRYKAVILLPPRITRNRQQFSQTCSNWKTQFFDRGTTFSRVCAAPDEKLANKASW